jgi:hypothetical protein
MPSCTNKQRTQDQVLIQQILFYITSLYSHLAYGKGLLAIVVIRKPLKQTKNEDRTTKRTCRSEPQTGRKVAHIIYIVAMRRIEETGNKFRVSNKEDSKRTEPMYRL